MKLNLSKTQVEIIINERHIFNHADIFKSSDVTKLVNRGYYSKQSIDGTVWFERNKKGDKIRTILKSIIYEKLFEG